MKKLPPKISHTENQQKSAEFRKVKFNAICMQMSAEIGVTMYLLCMYISF